MTTIGEWFKIVLFFILVIILLVFLISLNEEKPHKVTIGGKEYIRIKEWNGRFYQITLLPLDSLNK